RAGASAQNGVRTIRPPRRRGGGDRPRAPRRRGVACRGARQMNVATPPSLPPSTGSSFHAAMRILPEAKRQAMFDIYGFCRAVDDIADDSNGPRDARHAALEQWRAEIEAIYAGKPAPTLAGLARSIAAYDLQRQDFLAIIDGMDMDVA